MNEANGIIWLASYPKSGNTWLRTFLSNYLNNDPTRETSLNNLLITNYHDRIRWDDCLGLKTAELPDTLLHRLRFQVQESIAKLGVSFFKTHEAFTDPLSSEALVSYEATFRVIYLIRDPRDLVISYARHLNQSVDAVIRHLGDPNFTMAKGRSQPLLQLPQRMGSWVWHVHSWEKGAGSKGLFVRYEDLLDNPMAFFSAICEFAGLGVDQRRLDKAVKASALDRLRAEEKAIGFRERPAHCATFFPCGQAGGWRTSLNSGQIDSILQTCGSVMRNYRYL